MNMLSHRLSQREREEMKPRNASTLQRPPTVSGHGRRAWICFMQHTAYSTHMYNYAAYTHSNMHHPNLVARPLGH